MGLRKVLALIAEVIPADLGDFPKPLPDALFFVRLQIREQPIVANAEEKKSFAGLCVNREGSEIRSLRESAVIQEALPGALDHFRGRVDQGEEGADEKPVLRRGQLGSGGKF